MGRSGSAWKRGELGGQRGGGGQGGEMVPIMYAHMNTRIKKKFATHEFWRTCSSHGKEEGK
jgi:hypothetical protein